MFAALRVPNFRRYVSGQALSLIGTWATIQLESDPAYRGRVTALWSMALVDSTPIGSPIIGAISDVAGPRYALVLGAAACLAAVIIGRWPATAPAHHQEVASGNAGF